MKDFFTGLWDRFGAPVWDFLQQLGGAIWADIQSFGRQIEEWTRPLRDSIVAGFSSAWGWVNMAIGVVVFLSGLGVLSGNVLARFVGVVLASLSLVANFLFLPSYPVWSIVIIAIDVLVIYALTVHGREAAAA